MEKTKIVIKDTVVNDNGFNVIMYNDDITPFEYVVMLLNTIFDYPFDSGLSIAMNIHQTGKAVVYNGSMDSAYEKDKLVKQFNDEYGHLLQTTVERA